MRLSLFSGLTLVAGAFAQKDLITTLESQSDLSTLLASIQLIPGLAATLNGSSDITILAPTNTAFSNVDPASPEGQAIASKDVAGITSLLSYHVIAGKYLSTDVTAVPAFLQTLLTSKNTFDGAPATEVSGGQYLELVLAGKNVVVVSGELRTSTVTDAVCINLSARENLWNQANAVVIGHYGSRRHHRPQDRHRPHRTSSAIHNCGRL